MNERVGVIGIGLVGAELARLFVDRGYSVVGFDIDPARGALLRTIGGELAASARDVAERADRIVLALLDTDVVCTVVEGEGGVLRAARLPRLLIDTSTGDPDAVAALARRLAARGVGLVDATISGSSRQIAARQAVVMVGGDPADVERARELINAIGGRVFYVGGPGAGSRAKLATNLVLGLNRLVLAEGLVFAQRLGLDLEGFLALLKASPAYSVAMDVKGERMLRGDFAPDSRVRQHHKDVEIILRYARAAGQPLPLSEVHLALLERAIAAGDGELDNAAIIRTLRSLGPAASPPA